VGLGETGNSRESSLARCVEHLLGEPEAVAPGERSLLGDWLSARGLVLVPVADPGSFSMGGSFLGRFEAGWAVLFGIPPGPIFDPLGAAAGDGLVLEAAVIAPLELDPPPRHPVDPATGRVESIAIAPAAEAPMETLERVRAVAGRGLAGDRYSDGAGTFSTGSGAGRALTLVESAAISELRDAGVDLDAVDARRNLVVSGIDLDGLIGRRFRVGAVECFGSRRCEPCAHLQRLTQPGVLRGLVHRGGLRADLLTDGEISVGDEVAALD
jgi:MOSC domain-containing protein YiiM